MRLRLPITIRLTLAFALSMAVLLGAAGTFLYVRLSTELRTSADTALRAQADVLVSGIGQGEMAFGDATGAAVQEGQPFAQIVTPRGQVVESTEIVAGRPIVAPSVLRSLRRPAFSQRTIRGVEGTTRIYALPLTDEGRRLVVLIGSSSSNRDEILANLLLLLVIGGPVALLLASLAAWLITRGALRPVERMRREASAISVSDRSRRLPVPGTADEVERLAATLNSMLDRLQHAFDRERRFVDDASHELRTPISILKAELDLSLSRARSRKEVEAAVRSASEEADRLVALAEDLLVYSRESGGHGVLRREPVRVHDLVCEVASSFAAPASDAGVAIEVDPSDAVGDLDPTRVRQALRNVVDNALRHTPPGGVIRISAADASDGVRVVVEDSGTGFDPDLLGTALEPFARGSAERATSTPGAGLGLAIVQAVADAHDGTVLIENRPEGGARVVLGLPHHT